MRNSLEKHPLLDQKLPWKNPAQVSVASITGKLEEIKKTDIYPYHVQFHIFFKCLGARLTA